MSFMRPYFCCYSKYFFQPSLPGLTFDIFDKVTKRERILHTHTHTTDSDTHISTLAHAATHSPHSFLLQLWLSRWHSAALLLLIEEGGKKEKRGEKSHLFSVFAPSLRLCLCPPPSPLLEETETHTRNKVSYWWALFFSTILRQVNLFNPGLFL